MGRDELRCLHAWLLGKGAAFVVLCRSNMASNTWKTGKPWNTLPAILFKSPVRTYLIYLLFCFAWPHAPLGQVANPIQLVSMAWVCVSKKLSSLRGCKVFVVSRAYRLS